MPNEESERDLLLRYRPWLRVVAADLLQGRPPHLIEDCAAEGWIAMWKALPDGRDVAVKAPRDWWLKRQAILRMKTVVRDWHVPMKQRQHVFTDDVPDVIAASAELDNVELAYHHGEIMEAIDRLPRRQREYVLLRFWGGLTYSKLVDLGYNPSEVWSAVRPKLSRDLGHLAEVAA
jgi:DNA-directed RNA polymerase specialized sigma24 family protein